MRYMDFLMSDLKLEASSLIYPKHLIRCGTMVIIFKLTENGMSENLLNLFQDFLKKRKQRVVFIKQVSAWKNINVGVLQGSIIGLLLFLIHLNDLTEVLTANANYLQMILLCFLLYMTIKHLKMISIKIWK